MPCFSACLSRKRSYDIRPENMRRKCVRSCPATGFRRTMPPLFVYITAPDKECARLLARTLVSERLCACANIIDGMESFYWWQGVLENAHESVCIVKTTDAGYPALEKRVRELHPYAIPCVVALRLERGFAPFLQWIAEETRS